MRKEDYTKLIKDKKWMWAKEHFDALDTHVPKKLGKVDINPEEWIQFSIDHFDQAHQNHEEPRPHFDDFSKKMSTNIITLDYHKCLFRGQNLS